MRNIKSNQQGFSTVELMVGVGLVALVTLVMVTTQLMVSKDQVDLTNQLDQSIDENLAERVLFRDLSAIDPSYNNIALADDSGLGFYDYYPDVPGNVLTNSLKRYIKLTADNTGRYFSAIVQDASAGGVLIYDPTAAYKIGPTPTDFNKAATLEFKGLNNNNWVKAAREKFWVNGAVLMLDTPARLRPVASDGSIDMTVAPRSPTFVGYVDGDSFKPLTQEVRLAGLFKYTQPDTGAVIDTPDTFLRNAPSVGGGQSLIRLRALKVIQYYLETTTDTKKDCASSTNANAYRHAKLFKVVYEKGQFSKPNMLADKVCSFELIRDSVLKRMIYYKITKVNSKDNTTKGATVTAGL